MEFLDSSSSSSDLSDYEVSIRESMVTISPPHPVLIFLILSSKDDEVEEAVNKELDEQEQQVW